MDGIGQQLRILRAHSNYRQQDLADRAGISAAYLSQIESGKKAPSMAVLQQLANALEVTPDRLLATEGNGPTDPRRPHGATIDRPPGPTIRSREDIELALRSATAVESIVNEARHNLQRTLGERLGSWEAIAQDFCRLLLAYSAGTYRSVPWDGLVLMAAALAYVSEPDDISPDHLSHGHVDDMAVIAFTESLVHPDLVAFRQWEDRDA